MRDATREELEGISNYITSISKPTGINFFDVIDAAKNMQEFVDDHTQVLFCSPRTKKRILDLSIPMCEVVANPAIPDTEVYAITDEKLKKDFLRAIRGTDDSLWYNAEPIDWRQ